jgi:hypothetical protein
MANIQRVSTARARMPAVITALLVLVCIGLAARTALAGSAGQNVVRHSQPDAEQQGKTQAVAGAGAGGPGAVSSSITSTCGLAWSRVPSPNVGPSASVLVAVAAVASNDVWAAGHYGFSGALTLVEHWDGTAWSVVPSPCSILE